MPTLCLPSRPNLEHLKARPARSSVRFAPATTAPPTETNQPPHRHAAELARLLREAGADPNDSQALYNRLFEPHAGHLRILIEFGLGADRGGPWHARLNSAHGTPAQLLEDQLVAAAFENRPEWARLALAAGADPGGLGTRHPLRLGSPPTRRRCAGTTGRSPNGLFTSTPFSLH